MADTLDQLAVQVGDRVACTFSDCCIAGSFTATITALDRDDEYLYRIEFSNGVRLTETLALVMLPATPQPEEHP